MGIFDYSFLFYNINFLVFLTVVVTLHLISTTTLYLISTTLYLISTIYTTLYLISTTTAINPYSLILVFLFVPQDFHVGSSSFTIPKTKKQTVNEKSAKISSMNKNSAQGEWIQTNGRRKAPTQLQLIPDAQGRAQKRSNTNENSQNSTPKKLRRPWLHASAPTSSDSNVSSQNSGSSGSTVGPSAGMLNHNILCDTYCLNEAGFNILLCLMSEVYQHLLL